MLASLSHATRPERRPVHRRVVAGMLAGLVAAGSGVAAAPAYATTLSGGSEWATLQDAIIVTEMVLAGADTIVLDAGASITAPDGSVEGISEDLTIDLNGGTVTGLRLLITGGDVILRNGTWISTPAPDAGLVAPGIGVGSSASLTLDGVTVVASGSECDAAIGGWYSVTGGPGSCDGGSSVASGAITIIDSSVTATGGLYSAGIGAASRGDQGPITITGSTVTATGGVFGAGIGTGKDRVAGTIDIVDSTVTATGGAQSAGIGGGDRGHGGTLSIEGGSVTATGTGNAAGIGGGFAGNGGTTTITGDAVVTATGGSFGAGIGGGIYGIGGTTSIGGTATVTATGRDGGPGIGSSYTSDPGGPTTITDGAPTLITASIQGSFDVAVGAAVTLAPSGTTVLDGASSNAGTITVTAPSQVEIPSGDTLTNLGRIEGAGTLRGTGTLDNQGVVCAAVDPGLAVTGDAFLLEYQLPGGGTQTLPVYAANLSTGCRELLDASTETEVLVGWRIGEGGEFLSTSTDLPVAVPSGFATLEPVLRPAVLTFAETETQSRAGETVQVTATAPLPLSNQLSSDVTEFVALSGDLVPGDLGGSFSTRTVGEQVITGTTSFVYPSREYVFTGTFTHTTTPGELATIALSPSATTVMQGGSVTLRLIASDAFGNQIDLEPEEITVTSSVSTDVIDGLTVSFPTASPHVLTVSARGVSSQVTIEVIPALAATGGSDPSDLAPVGLALLALGAIALRRAHVRRP